MADNKTKLFSEFPEVSTQEWMDKVTVDLKGADFEKKLVWRTNEGFNARPFYRQEDLDNLDYLNSMPGDFPYVRGVKTNNNAWFVRQDIRVQNAKDANAKALDVLMKGVNSIGFCFDSKALITEANIKVLLKNICLESAEINFSSKEGGYKDLVSLFTAYVKSESVDPKTITGSINFDPYGNLLCCGTMCAKNGDIDVEYVKSMIDATSDMPNFKIISVNAKHVSNAGAYIAQELGYGLSMASEYLAKLTNAGISANDVVSNMKFNFAVSANYFMEMAKFRAARLLWAQIATEYGADKDVAKMIAHAETSQWNMTVYDAQVNMLRSQTEAMSASLAGVHSLTVLPFDKSYKVADVFSERIARNQQLLLKEESHFDKIVDPSAGSYYIENLTDSLAQEAWKLFVSIETEGGFLSVVTSGKLQMKVKASADKRSQFIAQRREVLLGTNQYPNTGEFAKDKIETKESGSCTSKDRMVEPLEFSHGSQAFDALRLATEAAEKRPVVFMLKMGNLAMRQARGQFAGNFFACAGYEIKDNLGYNTIEEGLSAAAEAKADIIVICSSDAEYAELAPKAFNALGGKSIFVVAGSPACMDELKAAGIENFIHVRSNVLEELKGYNTKLGI